MRSYIFICIAWVLFGLSPKNGQAQSAVAPGGLPGYALWWTDRSERSEGPRQWQTDRGNHVFTIAPGKSPHLNGWPLLPLEEWPATDLPRLVLPAGPVTLFTVYLPDASVEETIIWSFYREEEARIVLTNHRLADLEQASYLHWPNHLHHQPRLVSYLHAGEANTASRLALGHKPADPDLPVTQSRGGMGEVIAYPGFLGQGERQRVETYLALKYGLTLGAGQDYLSPDGTVIWDATRDSAFHYRITGLGHMPAAGWLGTESTSVIARPVDQYTLSTADSLQPGQYLIAGDNDRPLQWEPEQGKATSQRQWRVRRSGLDEQKVVTKWTMPVRPLLGALADPMRLALLIDRSGQGTYIPPQTDTIWVDDIDPHGRATFTIPTWDPDHSGTDQVRLFSDMVQVTTAQEAPDWQVSVYPNPVRSGANIQWLCIQPSGKNLDGRAFISDTHGRILANWDLSEQSTYANTWQSDVPGVYWFTIQSGDQLTTQKLIVL